MPVTDKKILNRMYLFVVCMVIFAILVAYKIVVIQFVEGDKYRELAEQRMLKEVVIPANRGNVYAADGNLLATTIPKYEFRFDAISPLNRDFEKHISALSDSLGKFYGRSSSSVQKQLRKARENNNRYMLIARNLGYSEYKRIKNFPLFNLESSVRSGLIVEQTTKREHPLGGMAQRTIGYERIDEDGNVTRPGIDGAFGLKYLRGTDGKRLKQRIGNGKWKPVLDYNQVEPKDGFDVYTTLNPNIQDVAHHALLEQLIHYKADHGTVVVMEVKTGEIKAIANLKRTSKGKYYEALNYAVGESHEPGSTFKLMAITAALEDRLIDTSDIVDTKQGVLSFYGKKVRDSKRGGYGKISVSEAFERSSNTGIVSAIDKAYRNNPKKFVERLYTMNLNKKLDLPIIGEPDPIIPHPDDKKRWSGIALQWMAYGYGVSFTPLQTLAFYNAIANDGILVKPRFLKSVKEFDRVVKTFDKEVINNQICSPQTVKKVQALLENVVEKEHGTGHKLYSPNFSIAGKTGTTQKNYTSKDKLNYISSFVGYFPADNPKYSCIVVIHEPDKSIGYYGADVSGPVFKKVAQKIFTDTPIVNRVQGLVVTDKAVESSFQQYYNQAQKYKTIMPDVVGLPTMDAVALLENMGLSVELNGSGIVTSQSIQRGDKVVKNQKIVLQHS